MARRGLGFQSMKAKASSPRWRLNTRTHTHTNCRVFVSRPWRRRSSLTQRTTQEQLRQNSEKTKPTGKVKAIWRRDRFIRASPMTALIPSVASGFIHNAPWTETSCSVSVAARFMKHLTGDRRQIIRVKTSEKIFQVFLSGCIQEHKSRFGF